MQTGEDILFTAPGPDPIPTATTEIVGTPGNALNVYWLVSHFPIGSVVSGPFPQKSSPNVLDTENYVHISWLPTPGASSYDLLFTKELKLPKQPGRFLLAGNLTDTEFRDMGQGLDFYDVAGIPLGAPQEEHIYFDNRDFKQPTLRFIPWPIQVSSIIFEDGSSLNTAGAAGGAAPPDQSVQFNDHGAFRGSQNLTWLNSDLLFRVGDIGGYHVDITPQYFGPPTGFPTIGLFYGTDPNFSFVGGMVLDGAGFDAGISIKAQAGLRITNAVEDGGIGGRPIYITSGSSLYISSLLNIGITTGLGPFASITMDAGESHVFLQQFSSGNVGIGRFPYAPPNFGNPIAKLDVHKETQDAPSLTPGSPAHFILGVPNFLIELAMGIDPNYNCWIQSRNANAPSGLTNPLSLNPLGSNVGIGTQNVDTGTGSAALQVTAALPGGARAADFKSNDWRLPSLGTDNSTIRVSGILNALEIGNGYTATGVAGGWIQSIALPGLTADQLNINPLGGTVVLNGLVPLPQDTVAVRILANLGNGLTTPDVGYQNASLGIGTNPCLKFGLHSSGGYGWIQSVIYEAVNPLLLNPLGGNVGINTQNPQAPLSVSAFGTATIPVVRIETNSAGGFCYISLENPTLYYPSGVKFLSQGNFMGEINQDGYGNIQIIAAGSNQIQFYTEATGVGGTVGGALGTLRMRIDSLGRVGIGTQNPQFQFDVTGDINISDLSSYRVGGNPGLWGTFAFPAPGGGTTELIFQGGILVSYQEFN